MADKVVTIPGVGNVSFPDSMSNEEIEKAAGELHGSSGPTLPPAPLGWPARYPKTAAATKAVVNALPGIGGVVGTAIAGPETMGLAAIPAAALGVGAGRGLRDLIAEGLGLDAPTTPLAKGGRIALDTGEAAAAQAILPGLWEAIKTPGKTLGEIVDMLPARLRPNIPTDWIKAPAAILQRPAWQTWSDHLDLSQAASSAETTAKTGTPSPQMVRNLLGIAARRARVTLTPELESAAGDLMTQGATAAEALQQAAGAVRGALTASESKLVDAMSRNGASDTDIQAAVQAARAFNAKFGLKTPTAAETRFPKGMRGKVNP